MRKQVLQWKAKTTMWWDVRCAEHHLGNCFPRTVSPVGCRIYFTKWGEFGTREWTGLWAHTAFKQRNRYLKQVGCKDAALLAFHYQSKSLRSYLWKQFILVHGLEGHIPRWASCHLSGLMTGLDSNGRMHSEEGSGSREQLGLAQAYIINSDGTPPVT